MDPITCQTNDLQNEGSDALTILFIIILLAATFISTLLEKNTY